MNQLSDVMVELNKFHKAYFKRNRLVNYILSVIATLCWLVGATLARIGISKGQDPTLGQVMDSNTTKITNGTTPEPGSTPDGTTPEPTNIGTKPEPAFKIGEMEVYKPEFFIPGAILAGLGGLIMLTYGIYKYCIKSHY